MGHERDIVDKGFEQDRLDYWAMRDESCTSGRAGGLICEPLKAVWPAMPACSPNPISSYFLSLGERTEVRVPNANRPPGLLPEGEGTVERSVVSLATEHRTEKLDKHTPANVKLYESPSRAGGLPTIKS